MSYLAVRVLDLDFVMYYGFGSCEEDFGNIRVDLLVYVIWKWFI